MYWCPKPCLRLSRLAAGVFVSDKTTRLFVNMSVIDDYNTPVIYIYVFLNIFETTKWTPNEKQFYELPFMPSHA